ncbi:winged helix-turn-helix transcriptional regulator [Photobacterium galatheae]|uniref:Transcriptional regulator n=1 Tax=Photobacterium galatheae TaxID=1654360 RepID=A0A066RRR5_9GAMM|nr:helix-turn-helix domain-containing protein [Photobacterium galatheae]KDM91796.1 transcriptional regulator [Photobacterium galatheae]MCM0147110.1 helix-turn-helix transcriptional regulator [Photobacterium galatheae]
MTRRSNCPISNVLDIVGDKWSLLILRDLMFFGKRSYSELQHSEEKVATNILSNRLERLEKDGLITKRTDENDKRKKLYALTQAGKDMLPILLEMIMWSSKYDPNTNAPKQLIERAKHDRETLINDLLARIES